MTVLVLALQERGGAPLPLHQDEVVLALAPGARNGPYPGSPHDSGCKDRQVGGGLRLKRGASPGPVKGLRVQNPAACGPSP